MSKQPYNKDNLDYNKLVKIREEKAKQQAQSKNPFLISKPNTDKSLYQNLYKFDVESELAEYAFPMPTNLETGKKTQLSEQRSPQKASMMYSKIDRSKASMSKSMNREMMSYDSPPKESEIEEEKGQDEMDEQGETEGGVEKLLKDMYSDKNAKQVNKIQHAFYYTPEVLEHLKTLQSGEEAIKFFATYGNSTPIKYINCIRADSIKDESDNIGPPKPFRPYDLLVLPPKDGDINLAEYYTISAHGIVHVHADKYRKNTQASTEFVSLSEWMHESTLFNIITKLPFFNNFVIAKIFNIWKLNVRYRKFNARRRELVKKVFYAKPQFAEKLSDMNKLLFEFHNTKTINIVPTRSWDIEEFKTEQKKIRNEAKTQYEAVFEKIVTEMETVKKQVHESKNLKLPSELEENKFGKQNRQKPIVQMKKEAAERHQRITLADRDEKLLGNFVRLIDYMMVANLVGVNNNSMFFLIEEMKKERKNGLFIVSVTFGDNNGEGIMIYNPPEDEIRSSMESVLRDMIDTVSKVSRISNHINFESLVRDFKEPDVPTIIYNSREYKAVAEEMRDRIKLDFQQAEDYVKANYEKCREIDVFAKSWNKEDYEKASHSIQRMQEDFDKFQKWISNIARYITEKTKGIIYIDGKRQVSKLHPVVKDSLETLRDYIYSKMKEKAANTLNDLRIALEQLNRKPETLAGFASFIENLKRIKDERRRLELATSDVETMHGLLKRFDNNPMLAQDAVDLEDLQKDIKELTNAINLAEITRNEKNTDMKSKLEKDTADLQADIINQATNINSGDLISQETPIPDALAKLSGIKTLIEKYKARNRTIANQYELVYDQESKVNKYLVDLEEKYADRNTIWTNFDVFRKQQKEWFTNDLRDLDVEEVERYMKTYDRDCKVLKVKLSEVIKEGRDTVLERLTAEVNEIMGKMPIIMALGNKDLKERHWKKIFKLIDKHWSPGVALKLGELLTSNIMDHKEQVEEISGEAQGQAQILKAIDAISKKWAELAFLVQPYREYKDRFIIGSVDDIIAALDDHQLNVQTMLATRFVSEIRSQVEEWEKKLGLISEVIDEWLTCQRQWMYLENIFNAEDIQKQLPAETAKFKQVDKFWRELMIKTNNKKIVLELCANEELLKKLQSNNQVLEDIQKGLDNYLETKRGAFPRFYFLSDDELLEILSQTRNPHAVQNHLRKCFDNINKINFTEEENSKEIVAMVSAEPETDPETVQFSASVMAEGPVEHWLFNIQEMMVTTLYDITKRAYLDYPANGLERDDWLFNYAAQTILVVDIIKWTWNATQAISDVQTGKNKNGIVEFLEFSREQIKKMINLVRKNLTTGQRTMLGALIVIDVHARDVVDALIKNNVKDLNDFEWTKQLRYYWEPDVDNCVVRQTNTRFIYSYEYLGNGPRLVITPLTDKCYMTLTGALHLNYGGAPAGPAGTGKTETTKDLAKALAVQCIVFNCSDNIDYKTMGRFFSGLSQGGAWACFDEFNRIDIEVLSVIAQQILTIQQAIRRKDTEFLFEGRTIPLNPRFGVFITMNPGYAGRTELPDNLKALFRPVAMMIPDYALIAEIILFSEGFNDAQNLARKMVQLYKLSSEQLSKQDHYDFGMRAVKSVLVMAGSLRRSEAATLSEDIVLIRAMKNSNEPKFLKDDLVLFRKIIEDLFPQKKIPVTDYGRLRDAIENQLEERKYQKPEPFVDKIIQLMETVKVRHGVMLVGVTGTGKTTVCHTLAKAMTQLNKEGSEDYYHKLVNLYTLNPKSISMNELFGYTNLLTNEWTDGIVAQLVRAAVADKSDSKKWVVFDGPVDAGWIENMNTVLDDNKMLCLPNGERIKLPATFTMMFEVQDLAVASPATVSRCGMVFMETIYLGWQPILDTWIASFKQTYAMKDGTDPKWMKLFLDKLKLLTKESLEYVKSECLMKIPSVDSNLVQSTLNIIDTMFAVLKDHFGPHTFEKDLGDLPIMILVFSLSWAMGGNTDDDTKNKFSNFFKLKIMGLYPNYPYDGEIYDFFIDFDTKTFKNWTTMIGKSIPEYKYNKKTPFFNILVPTGDTVKYKFLIKNLMANGFNVLITGDTGVGKSVITQEFLISANDQKDDEPFMTSSINFSAQTTSNNLMNVFNDKLKKRKRDLLGPPAGKKMFLFIDDVNMPQLDRYGAQPPVELLRQVIDQGGFYDLKKLMFTYVKDTQFICACAPPGGGRNAVTPRLFRHFNMFWMPQLSTKSMEKIFVSILDGYINESGNKDIQGFAPSIVKASIDIYQKTISKLLPTPAKSHYTFNLRDLSKVIQGILQVGYESLPNKEVLFQLWVHETCRVFQDRLVDDKDRGIFNTMVEENLKNYLDMSWTREEFNQFMFGDYTNVAREYMRIENPDILPKKFNDFLTLYNSTNTKTMDLVFFKDAIEHLSRICRILRQPRGNALLIGVGGSGRQSLTRLAASIRGYQSFSIEITKNYKDQQFKDDLKKVLKIAGAKNNPIVFIFSDTQIVKETFLEDINNILNTGEVPNLWAREDIEEINQDLRNLAKERGRPENMIYPFFVELCRENLHIVLTFSPVGNKLRERCLQFPSVINCCTIDWYDKWPEEALYSVAVKTYSSTTQLDIENFDKLVKALAQMSVEIHTTVIDYSDKFYNELKRKNYTTPTSYLELLKLYIMMLKIQQNIIPMKIRKYTVGLQTLKETNEMVSELQIKIKEMQPILDQKAKENAALMIELESKSKAAAIEEENCKKEAGEAQLTADEVSELRDSCKKDLDEAMPILLKAQKAVSNIDKKDIYELKAMSSPPELVGVVMAAVCLLVHKDKKKETWEDSKKLLGDMNFLGILQDYNSDNTPEKILERLRSEYLSRPNFNEEAMRKVSVACATIMNWVIAIDKYAKVKKIVGPKEKSLKEAEVKLAQVQGELAKKQAALKEVQDTVARLKSNLDSSIRNAESLKQKQELAVVQLGRAEKLVAGLGDESKRWTKTVENLRHDLRDILGNIMVAAAIIAYLGPFTAEYRVEMINKWIKRCKHQDLGIPVSDNFNLQKILADDVIIREWQKYGLPADDLSLDNGIIVFNCKRWPLIIDPQGQANKWIKNLGRDSNIQITKLTEANFMRTLENAIKFGQPVLLENVEEQLDPSLEPILLKQIFQKGTQKMLKLGETDIPYNDEFRFYITTKMPNPHYLPETCIKVTLINFTVTPSGLEDQLLVEVVKHERIELEEMRDQLIVQISEDKAELQSLEDRILKKIAEVAGNILNDEEIISILEASKVTSETINKRMAQAQITAKEINDARENYRVVAKRGSALYFVIADLARIDPMYQYSLDYFIKLFQIRLKNSEHPPELQARLNVLIEDLTKSFFNNICRGLFEKDKLLFSFAMAVKIQIGNNQVNSKEWNFFLRGPSVESNEKSEPPAYLSDAEGHKVWRMIVGLEDSHRNFIGIASSFKDSAQSAVWRAILENDDPVDLEFPEYYEKTCTDFQKLMILRVIRQEKLIIAVKKYVKNTLGPVFIESPPFNLKAAFEDSTATTPLIFILSPGADPMTALLNLAKEKEMDGPRFKILSLGQGQGQIAAEFIKNARNSGDWVCLQNCHLAATWMTDLERLQEGQVEGEVHEEYRLWLTSMPTNKFPVPVLQSGIKITNEPPKGLKANLRRTFLEVEESLFESSTKPAEFKKLLFSLAFFHAVILERRKFGAIGWNIPYEWMNSDFETCLKQLHMYLDEQPIVPYVTLRFLISEINYGGRVTDDKDVRLITSLLSKYFTSQVMTDTYKFSPSGIYYAPQPGTIDEVRTYIDNLPLEDDPEVFGLHPNANITFQQKTVFEFMSTLTSINPKVSEKGGGGVSNNDLVLAMAIDIQNKIPERIEYKKTDDMRPLEVFKSQEIDRFNQLCKIIRKSLKDLQNAINGYVVMSLQLEKVYTAFLDKKVPALWADNAYPSLKPLSSWVDDLAERLKFMQSWVKEDPKSYWVPAFFFPQGFMTSVLQTYARNPENPTPIDVLTFRTEVRKFHKNDVQEVPRDGVNVHGIFIEGCRWDIQKGVLAEAEKGVLIDEMPCIWLEPVRIENYTNAGTYKSPLYKTSERRGTLSTTGHSTNFVLYLDLKTDQDQIHWVRRGVALLCQKDE